jgi:hypothetical protein
MLYSHNNQYPRPLPYRIVLSDGRTRTDHSSFTAEELLDAGYALAPNPPEISQLQVLEWAGTSWAVRDKTSDELLSDRENQWYNIRNMRDKMLAAVDWRYLRLASQTRLGVATSDTLEQLDAYAQALRDVTQQADPLNIQWPVLGAPNGN